MEENYSWREMLGNLTSGPQERLRIAQALWVNPVTLIRWAMNISNPRPGKLHALLPVLLEEYPHLHQQILISIQQEFPDSYSEQTVKDQVTLEIPAAFYARVLATYATSPPLLRSSTIRTLILQQILGHLDPKQLGL